MSDVEFVEALPGTTVPSTTLGGDAERNYVDAVLRGIRGARLNNFFGDARRLRSHLGALHPDVHRGLYEGVQVDLRTGLPTYREFTRAQTDISIAADQLRQLGARDQLVEKARAQADSIWAKQLRKHDYYSDIHALELAPLGEMTVALRRIDPNTSTAAFHIVLDKLDVSGCYVRYSIDLEQRRRFWGSASPSLTVDSREVADHSAEFRALIYKFTPMDAEFTFVKLASMEDLSVERVSKGSIGPFWFDFMPDSPVELADCLAHGPVASFAFDTVAADIAEPRINDPFPQSSHGPIDPSRAGFDRTREVLGYKVFKDRKFVVPSAAMESLRAACDARGTKNIAYRF